MRYTLVLSAGAAFVAFASTASSQASTRPPIRPLGVATAKSAESFGSIGSIRPLSGGRVLVNDPGGRKVVMLDASLSPILLVADSTSATANAYSSRFAGILSYRGDSSLFIDPQSLSMLVIDPAGKVARVMSVPRSEDAMALAGVLGGAAFDGESRLIYRGSNNMRFRRDMTGGAHPGAGAPPEAPDTAAVIRVDLATRVVDTVAWVKIPKINIQMSQDDKGGMTISRTVNPLPTVDEWAVLPDGSIAIVRGRDYHVDWIRRDGTRSSSPKLAFDWQRMTDEDKAAFIDSAKAARARLLASEPAAASGGATGGPGGGATVMSMRVGGPGGTITSSGTATVDFVGPEELPDYRPAFFAGALRVDGDGNLWIRTTAMPTVQGATVYDVVNPRGELTDRVQVPAGRTIAGFGSDGAVYLTSRDGSRTVLERASVR